MIEGEGGSEGAGDAVGAEKRRCRPIRRTIGPSLQIYTRVGIRGGTWAEKRWPNPHRRGNDERERIKEPDDDDGGGVASYPPRLCARRARLGIARK